MPRTRNVTRMKTRSSKTASAAPTRGAARGPTTRARASLAIAETTSSSGRKAPQCKHCGKPRAGHGKKCLDGYSKATELERMQDQADALAHGVAEAEQALLRERIDEEVTKAFEAAGGTVSVAEVVKTLGAQIEKATGETLSMQELVDALPALITADEDDAPAAQDSMHVDDVGSATGAAAADKSDTSAAAEPGTIKPTESAAAGTPGGTDAASDNSSKDATLPNGWKSTPAGDTPLELERGGMKKSPYPTQIERSKRIPRLFQAMAQKGDVLANRADGWAFCVFVPKNGRGEMRTWHSEQVEAEVPSLPGAIRELVFETLEPIRRQRLAESAKIDKERRKELKRWQKEAANAKSEVESLRAQLDEAMKSLRVEKAVVNASKA